MKLNHVLPHRACKAGEAGNNGMIYRKSDKRMHDILIGDKRMCDIVIMKC
jgi:hypothetical protein